MCEVPEAIASPITGQLGHPGRVGQGEVSDKALPKKTTSMVLQVEDDGWSTTTAEKGGRRLQQGESPNHSGVRAAGTGFVSVRDRVVAVRVPSAPR